MGTRYRGYAFSDNDYGDKLKIESKNGEKVLSVNGVVRTVIEGTITLEGKGTIEVMDGRYVRACDLSAEHVAPNKLDSFTPPKLFFLLPSCVR